MARVFFILVAALAWPVACVMLCVHFKREISGVLARIRKISAGDATIDIAEFDNATESVKALPAVSATAEALGAAAVNPRDAVLEGWAGIEAAINAVAENNKIVFSRGRPNYSVRLRSLVDAKHVDASVVEPFERLKELYLEVKSAEDSLPVDRAKQFVEAASVVSAAIKKVT